MEVSFLISKVIIWHIFPVIIRPKAFRVLSFNYICKIAQPIVAFNQGCFYCERDFFAHATANNASHFLIFNAFSSKRCNGSKFIRHIFVVAAKLCPNYSFRA